MQRALLLLVMEVTEASGSKRQAQTLSRLKAWLGLRRLYLQSGTQNTERSREVRNDGPL